MNNLIPNQILNLLYQESGLQDAFDGTEKIKKYITEKKDIIEIVKLSSSNCLKLMGAHQKIKQGIKSFSTNQSHIMTDLIMDMLGESNNNADNQKKCIEANDVNLKNALHFNAYVMFYYILGIEQLLNKNDNQTNDNTQEIYNTLIGAVDSLKGIDQSLWQEIFPSARAQAEQELLSKNVHETSTKNQHKVRL